MVGILYISYDGVLEPLGQSQVLAYLKRLTEGRNIHLISFEKEEDWENVKERDKIALDIYSAGIIWHPLRYHKRPSALATGWDILCGISFGLWLVIRYRLHIVHARSYVPSVMALALKRLTGVKFIFDMRGFWADEKVDGGSWRKSDVLYKVAKRFEQSFLLSADHLVSLTHAAVAKIQLFSYLNGYLPPLTVIPTCADLKRFAPVPEALLGRSPNYFVLGYVGSVGTYYLFDEVVTCFLKLRQLRPEAIFLIVNRDQHDYLLKRLSEAGVPRDVVELTSATHAEMPFKIARMSAGIFFIKPVFSKQASAPTKLAEFLGCGIPCLGNVGVGDMEAVLEGDKVGVALKSFDEESIKRGLERFLRLVDSPETSARCVKSAQRHFSLDEGVARYQLIYNLLAN
jgi:glycosyltransferase involved in cell wall biosynthesis